MIEIETKDATDKLRKLADDLSERQIRKAIVRSLNKGIQMTNTVAKRAVRERYNVKSYNIDKTTKPISASPNTLTAKLAAERGTLSLSAFNPTSIQTGMGGQLTRLKRQGGKAGGVTGKKISRGKTGVYVEIIKGQKEALPGAFMGFWNNKNGASGGAVFARGEYEGSTFQFAKGRAPISKLKTKSVYWSILNDAHSKKIIDNGATIYEAELLRQLEGAINHGNI
jgi:hypothetical protein